MIKTIGIVSLSRGILGESFVKHELDLGVKRLEAMGLNVKFMPNSLKGLEYTENHPEARAKDLLDAFNDPQIDMILCAIGGDDTFRLLPYLFENDELKNAVTDKVFLGFSDTTVNHFMLHKVGLKTFYGQSFLADVCELGPDMFPYSRKYFEELISTGSIEKITPSDTWYAERTDFSPEAVGTLTASHKDHGWELLKGPHIFSGRILGGCIDSLYDFFDGERYAEMPVLCARYHLFPDAEDWKDRILLLESSEEKMSPEKYKKALDYLKNAGVFDVVAGVIVGKPQDEVFYEEYKKCLTDTIGDPDLPIVYNINIGHAQPRCIIPFGVEATVDAEAQSIVFKK